MADPTNKDLIFLSDKKLIGILRSVLDELDVVARVEAPRSTTYLAVSAIEGLFGGILKLRGIFPKGGTVPPGWPLVRGKPTLLKRLPLEKRIELLHKNNALPSNFEQLYHPLR